jgi:uncharacterized protein (TIGR03032 family)
MHRGMTLDSPQAAAPRIELRAHGRFVEWLAAARGTVAVTTYNSGKLAMFCAPAGRLECRLWRLVRPMGLAYDGGRLAIATREEIREWRLAPAEGDHVEGSAPPRFELAATHATSRLDVHELAYDSRGLVFANTRFNCLARPSSRARFRRAWSPWFMPEPAARDCCHLNGLGLHGGSVALATAFCTGGEPGSWRSGDRFTSGVVLDVRHKRVAVRGLCLPHSPRWHAGQWWLCNSGAGTLATFDPVAGSSEPVALLPGFTRGLAFAAGHALVGLSRIRKRHILDAPPVRERFPQLRSGVWLVDPTTGRTSGALEFVRGGREVFDVAFLPGILRPELELPVNPPESA